MVVPTVTEQTKITGFPSALDRKIESVAAQIDADKLRNVIDRYVYTGEKPLPDPDIIELINYPLKLAERGPTKTRVLGKVVDYVMTFIRGIAA